MKRYVLWLFSLAFIGIGLAHFTHVEKFLLIMPPYLPAHRELVYLSGVCEILGGIGLQIPPFRRTAGWGLIALLLAVFPANIHMAVHSESFQEMGIPLWALYARLPVQFGLMIAIWWAIKPKIASS